MILRYAKCPHCVGRRGRFSGRFALRQLHDLQNRIQSKMTEMVVDPSCLTRRFLSSTDWKKIDESLSVEDG